MPCSCAMMSPSDISLEEEEGANVDGANRDAAERDGGKAESICRDLNCASLCLIVAAFMAYMTKKWVEKGK